MATESFISLRRLVGLGMILLLLGFCVAAMAQVATPPFVVSSFATSPAHSTGWGQTTGAAVAPNGDVVYVDVETNHVWHFPADGRAAIDVGYLSSSHTWQNNFGLAIDSKMTLWVGANYALNGLWRVPYDTVNKTWNISQGVGFGCSGGGGSHPECTGGVPAGPGWYQATAVAVDKDDNLVVGTLNSSGLYANMIFKVAVNLDGTAGASQVVIYGMKSRPDWLAVDKAGDIFFVEEGYAGVFMLPAGQTIVGDGQGTIEKGPNGLPQAPLVRLDMLSPNSPASPTAETPAVFLLNGAIKGVAVDEAGNVYYGTQDAGFNGGQQGGIWMVPNEGTVAEPVLNPAHTTLVTPMRTLGGIAVDSKRDLLWLSTIPGSWSGWNGLNDIAKVSIGWADLGAAAVGTQGATLTVYNAFNHDDTIPADQDMRMYGYEIAPEGTAAANFVKIGGNCSGDIYKQNDRCTVTLAVKPSVVGPVGGALVSQARLRTGPEGQEVYQLFTVSTMTLRGMGQGGELAFLNQPVEATVGSAISGAGQVTTDKSGNVYVVSSDLRAVLVYPRGAGPTTVPTQLGSNLTAPTGVAVDGLGNVFIADSGNIVEVPFANGTWNSEAQVTIKTGLGTGLKLAVNPAGLLFVADPDNARVLRIRLVYPTDPSPLAPVVGISAPIQMETEIPFPTITGIGLDSIGNLLVADGTNVIKVDDYGQQTVVADQVGAAIALAMDPSGALYYTTTTGAFRIPVMGGVLSVANRRVIGAGLTAAAGIALDRTQNVYVADTAAANLHLITVHGVIDFGAINNGDRPTLDTEVFNVGNSPVTFTLTGGQFPSSNVIDFMAGPAMANGCDAANPLAAAGSCFVATTFNPGDGEQGPLAGQITLSSDTANGPVVLNAAGVGAALAASHTAMTVSPAAKSTSVPITVAVTPAEGSGTPTGQVTILIDGVTTATDVLTDGAVSFDLKPVLAGSHVYTAAYNGDRVYGRSTNVQTIVIAKGPTTIGQDPLTPVPGSTSAAWLPYVLGSIQNADAYFFKYPVRVEAAAGQPGGYVTLMEGTLRQATVKVDNGVATFDTSLLPPDPDTSILRPFTTHTVTPTYEGDANYLPATGTPVTFLVVRAPSVIVSSTPATITVAAGSTTTADITLTSMLGYGDLNGYRGAVELACDNPPPYTTCSFSPARVTVTGSAPGHSRLTVITNVPVGAVARNNAPGWVFAAMFGFGAIGLVFGRKTGMNGRVLMMICAVLIIGGALGGITACGTSTGANPNPAAVTPAGSYTVNIIGKQIDPTFVGQGWQQNLVSLPYSITVNVN